VIAAQRDTDSKQAYMHTLFSSWALFRVDTNYLLCLSMPYCRSVGYIRIPPTSTLSIISYDIRASWYNLSILSTHTFRAVIQNCRMHWSVNIKGEILSFIATWHLHLPPLQLFCLPLS